MEFDQLSEEETIALVGLIELLGESENELPDDEIEHITAVAREIGVDRYRAIAEEVDRRFTDEGELKAFLSTITRTSARELIYGTALEAALAGGVDPRESRLLEWLANEWRIQPTYSE